MPLILLTALLSLHTAGNGSVAAPNTPILNVFENDFTLEAWVKASSGTIIERLSSNGAQGFNMVISNGVPRMTLRDIGHGVSQHIYATSNIDDGQWHHVAFVRSSNSALMYVDGILEGNVSISSTQAQFNTSSTMVVDVEGSIDEIRAWNVARSASEIVAGMSMEMTGSETGLQAYYDCNQGVADGNNSTISSLTDSGPLSQHATFSSMTLNGSTENFVAGLTAFPAAANAPVAVTLTVTDLYGNSSSCTANVTVEDNVAPNAICQDITVELDANGQATITASDINNGSYDNCDIDTMTIDVSTFDCTDISGPLNTALSFDGSNVNVFYAKSGRKL